MRTPWKHEQRAAWEITENRAVVALQKERDVSTTQPQHCAAASAYLEDGLHQRESRVLIDLLLRRIVVVHTVEREPLGIAAVCAGHECRVNRWQRSEHGRRAPGLVIATWSSSWSMWVTLTHLSSFSFLFMGRHRTMTLTASELDIANGRTRQERCEPEIAMPIEQRNPSCYGRLDDSGLSTAQYTTPRR